MKFAVILDGGHGWNTPGKRSPFKHKYGRSILRENEFNDAMVNKTSFSFWNHGIETHIVSGESSDTSLNDRVSRANKLTARFNKENIVPIYISFHADAFTNPSVNGSRIYYQQIVQGLPAEETKRRLQSKKFAELLAEKFNDCVDVKKAKALPGNYKVTREVNCISILIEHGFMTNWHDVQELLKDINRNQWAENIVLCTIDDINEIVNS